MNMSNQKGFANIIVIGIVVAILLGIAGYFVLGNKTTDDKKILKDKISIECSKGDKVITQECGKLLEECRRKYPGEPECPVGVNKTEPTSTNTPPSTTNNTNSQNKLLVPTVNSYSLIFNSNSICIIGPDEGQCTVLQSNFSGGENVDVDGLQGSLRKGPDNSWSLISTTKISGSNITVKKLILNDNFVMNGNLAEITPESGQKMWSLTYQPPVGDFVNQDPNRPTNTIPLKFDEKSFCGDTGQINCNSYSLHKNDWVFVRGIKYKGVLIVRMFTIPAKAPSTLPR